MLPRFDSPHPGESDSRDLKPGAKSPSRVFIFHGTSSGTQLAIRRILLSYVENVSASWAIYLIVALAVAIGVSFIPSKTAEPYGREVCWSMLSFSLFCLIGTFFHHHVFLHYTRHRDSVSHSQTTEGLRTDLAHAKQLLQRKTDYLAFLAHELRNPLHGILNNNKFLTDKLRAPEDQEYAESITGSCQLMINIINDVLQLTKAEAGALSLATEPFVLKSLVNMVYFTNRSLAAAKGLNMTLSMDESSQDSILLGDETRLAQVITNIISNGIKYTDQGHVHISVALDRTFPEVSPTSVASSVPISGEEFLADHVFIQSGPNSNKTPPNQRSPDHTDEALAVLSKQVVTRSNSRSKLKQPLHVEPSPTDAVPITIFSPSNIPDPTLPIHLAQPIVQTQRPSIDIHFHDETENRALVHPSLAAAIPGAPPVNKLISSVLAQAAASEVSQSSVSEPELSTTDSIHAAHLLSFHPVQSDGEAAAHTHRVTSDRNMSFDAAALGSPAMVTLPSTVSNVSSLPHSNSSLGSHHDIAVQGSAPAASDCQPADAIAEDEKHEFVSLRIAVSDTGAGIPDDRLAGIFEPYRQSDNVSSSSTGLGLAIVKHLVTLMNGTIEVKSKVGQGSTFIINLNIERIGRVSQLPAEATEAVVEHPDTPIDQGHLELDSLSMQALPMPVPVSHGTQTSTPNSSPPHGHGPHAHGVPTGLVSSTFASSFSDVAPSAVSPGLTRSLSVGGTASSPHALTPPVTATTGAVASTIHCPSPLAIRRDLLIPVDVAMVRSTSDDLMERYLFPVIRSGSRDGSPGVSPALSGSSSSSGRMSPQLGRRLLSNHHIHLSSHAHSHIPPPPVLPPASTPTLHVRSHSHHGPSQGALGLTSSPNAIRPLSGHHELDNIDVLSTTSSAASLSPGPSPRSPLARATSQSPTLHSREIHSPGQRTRSLKLNRGASRLSARAGSSHGVLNYGVMASTDASSSVPQPQISPPPVSAHSILLESNAGHSSASVPVSHQAPSMHPVSPTRRRSLRVLLVEDNGQSLKLATRFLTDAGFVVDVATNGQQAVEMWKKQFRPRSPEPFSIPAAHNQATTASSSATGSSPSTSTRQLGRASLKLRPSSRSTHHTYSPDGPWVPRATGPSSHVSHSTSAVAINNVSPTNQGSESAADSSVHASLSSNVPVTQTEPRPQLPSPPHGQFNWDEAKPGKIIPEEDKVSLTPSPPTNVSTSLAGQDQEYTYFAILMDVNMPVMSGDKAALAIRMVEKELWQLRNQQLSLLGLPPALFAPVPIIALSGSEVDRALMQPNEFGVVLFTDQLPKPFAPQMMIEKVFLCLPADSPKDHKIV